MKRIHKVCTYLKQYEHIVGAKKHFSPCEECPAWRKDERYGKLQRMCYALASEALNIAQTGNPWRKKNVKWPGENR